MKHPCLGQMPFTINIEKQFLVKSKFHIALALPNCFQKQSLSGQRDYKLACIKIIKLKYYINIVLDLNCMCMITYY